jgi:hypothetical protein
MTWFVQDSGALVAVIGVICMLIGVVSCILNVYNWLGLSAWGIFAIGILVVASGMAVVAHWFTMTTDPGAVPKNVTVVVSPDDSLETNTEQEVPLNADNGILYCQGCDADRPRW